jgi:hypothetical protein
MNFWSISGTRCSIAVRRSFNGEKLSLPDRSDITAHTAEV